MAWRRFKKIGMAMPCRVGLSGRETENKVLKSEA